MPRLESPPWKRYEDNAVVGLVSARGETGSRCEATTLSTALASAVVVDTVVVRSDTLWLDVSGHEELNQNGLHSVCHMGSHHQR